MEKLHETIADIAYLAGQFGYYTGDSRADMRTFVALAKDFENRYCIDWETSDLDYITEVENYAKVILGLKQKLMLGYPEAFTEPWDDIVIEKVREEGGATFPIHDEDDTNPNDFWSVYVHRVEGGVMCVADLPTEELAKQFAEMLKRAVQSFKDNGYLGNEH